MNFAVCIHLTCIHMSGSNAVRDRTRGEAITDTRDVDSIFELVVETIARVSRGHHDDVGRLEWPSVAGERTGQDGFFSGQLHQNRIRFDSNSHAHQASVDPVALDRVDCP